MIGSSARPPANWYNQHVLPGEWYLARWGGTRKGSGSFYTRPGLAVPTVQRTLRPLAYDPPKGKSASPKRPGMAPSAEWTPKRPRRDPRSQGLRPRLRFRFIRRWRRCGS